MAAAVLVASAATLPRAGAMAQGTQHFELRFELAASPATTAEIFVDRGDGFDARTSLLVSVGASAEPLPYAVPLAPGRYRAVRFDPFPADGELVLQHARIADRHGHIVAPLDLSRLRPSTFVTVRAGSSDRVTATARAGHVDPQLVYTFEPPLILWLSRRDLAWFALEALLIGVVVATAAFLMQRPGQRSRAALPAWVAQRPSLAVALAATAATLVSMYPLLLGRSLVTPNNGPTPLVYATPPYAAGSSDTAIEDTRAADVKATMLVTLPYAMAQRQALADGEFPWWNRYSETGVPLAGQAQSSIFDPLQWLLFFGDLALGADLKFLAARIVFATGAGLAALAATESAGAASVIAVAAPFLGHFVFRLNDPIHFSIVYGPWILLAYGGMLRQHETRRAALAAAGLLVSTALVMFASSPKEAFALLPALHLAGVGAVVVDGWQRSGWSTTWRRLGLCAAAMVGAALLTAPHWLIFLETLASAFTAYDTSAFEFAGSTQAVAMVAGVFRPGMVYPSLNPALGVLILIAALRRRHWLAQPLTVSSAAVAAVMIVVAFGAVPEPWLARLPFFARIHHVGSTFSTAVLPLLLMVAAAGAASLGARPGNAHRTARAVLAGSLGVSSLTVYTLVADLSDPIAAIGLVACVWSGVLCYTAPAVCTANRLAAAVTAVAFVGLVAPSGLHLPTGSAALDGLLTQPRLRASLTTIPDALRSVTASNREPARIVGVNGVMQGGVSTYLGLEGVTGADALFSPQTFWLGKRFAPEHFPLWFQSPDAHATHLEPLLNLWGVRWLVAPRHDIGDARPTTSDSRLAVIERPSAWPRAFFVDRVEVHEDRERFVERLMRAGGPFASIRGSDDTAVQQTRARAGTAGIVLPAREYRLTANTTTLVVSAPAAGVVVLNEGFWPGVSAAVGGQAATVFRVNETMRAVAVPEGTWSLTFSYRPEKSYLALGLGGAGLLTLVVLLVAGRIGRPGTGQRAGSGAPA